MPVRSTRHTALWEAIYLFVKLLATFTAFLTAFTKYLRRHLRCDIQCSPIAVTLVWPQFVNGIKYHRSEVWNDYDAAINLNFQALAIYLRRNLKCYIQCSPLQLHLSDHILWMGSNIFVQKQWLWCFSIWCDATHHAMNSHIPICQALVIFTAFLTAFKKILKRHPNWDTQCSPFKLH